MIFPIFVKTSIPDATPTSSEQTQTAFYTGAEKKRENGEEEGGQKNEDCERPEPPHFPCSEKPW